MYVIKRAWARLHNQVVDCLLVVDWRISRLTSDQSQRLDGQDREPKSLEKSSSIPFNGDVIDHGHLHPSAPFRHGCSFAKSPIIRKHLLFGHLISPFCRLRMGSEIQGSLSVLYCARLPMMNLAGCTAFTRQRRDQPALRDRASVSTPTPAAISPNTNAPAAPITPLPVPGPPVATAKFSTPFSTAIRPATTAAMAPFLP